MEKSYFIVLAAFIGIHAIAFAQQPAQKNTDWKEYYKKTKVKIYYKYADCDIRAEGISDENVYLRFSNRTDKNISIQYEQEMHFGSKCYNCEGGDYEHIKRVILKPH